MRISLPSHAVRVVFPLLQAKTSRAVPVLAHQVNRLPAAQRSATVPESLNTRYRARAPEQRHLAVRPAVDTIAVLPIPALYFWSIAAGAQLFNDLIYNPMFGDEPRIPLERRSP